MKKTLSIIVFALAGAAHADIVFDWQTNPLTTTDLYNPTVTGASLTGQSFTNASTQKTGSNYVNSFLSPNVNVGSGNTWSVSLSFSVTEDVSIDSVTLDLFTFNGQNNVQQGNRQGAYTFNLKLGDNVLASCSNSDLVYLGTGDTKATGSQQASVETLGQLGGSSGVHEKGMLNQDVTLVAGNTYTLELSLDRGTETAGYFVGLGAIGLNAVPEPATASLSILGMAALMMRRRRR